MASQVSAPDAPAEGTSTKGEGTTEKSYVYGGAVGSPEMGANSRRLWSHLRGNLSKKDLRAIRAAVREAQPETDRFVRWQRIVAAAEKLSVTIGKGDDAQSINQALVRRLAVEDKGGKVGKDKSITFTV